VKDKSSEFDPNQNNIRRDGRYIYEPFLPTQGTDIKVYTVGAGYVHAEARKAPTVDGKVQRSKDGKEIRYPVVLTQGEKAMAAFIVKAFQQNICGFDILRTDGGSYVCDVNGWSFVKGNQKYYNDCSTLIRKHLLEACGLFDVDTSTMMILGPGEEDITRPCHEMSAYDYAMRESILNSCPERLRSVIVVMRHGDRRPKEKMKFKTKHPAILAYFDNAEANTTEVKLKTPEAMQKLKGHMESVAQDIREQIDTLMQPDVPIPRLLSNCSNSSVEAGKKSDDRLATLKQELLNVDLLIPVLEMKDRFAGLERKVQLKASKWKPTKEGSPRKAAVVLVVAKWGGELTVSGVQQATELGYRLRHDLYPNDPTGLLRLHSSFRHDFKIYSSQEGRCQITAAAFTKGFLDLEGDIIPILVSLVTRDSYAQELLDEPIPKKQRDAVKQKIESLLLCYKDMSSPEVIMSSCPTEHSGLRDAAHRIGSPLRLLHTLRKMMAEYVESIAVAKDNAHAEMHLKDDSGTASEIDGQDDQVMDNNDDDAVPLGQKVPLGPGPMIDPDDPMDASKRCWLHLRRKEHRWRKLMHGFIVLKDEEKGSSDDENITYDASKIPDVWDNLYYDLLTHRHYLGKEPCKLAEKMVGLIHPLNEWVCLSEYGICQEEKLSIGVDVTWRLIGKMLGDLEFMIDDDVGKLDAAGRRVGVTKSSVKSGGTPSIATPAPKVAKSGRRMTGFSEFGMVPTLPGAKIPSPKNGDSTMPSHKDEDGPQAPLQDSNTGARSVKSGHSGLSVDTNMGDVLPELAPKGQWREWATEDTCSKSSSPRMFESDLEAAPVQPVSPVSDRTPPGRDSISGPISPKKERLASSVDGSVGSEGVMKKTRSKLARLTTEVREELKHALRDSSDWHPRLNDQVENLTDIRNTRIVRSRIYVTSASTMHSLVNILRHGTETESSGGKPLLSDFGGVIDLSYLTHIVFRCYERDAPVDNATWEAAVKAHNLNQRANAVSEEAQDAASGEDGDEVVPTESLGDIRKSLEKMRYRVEIAISPGVQVVQDGKVVQWPQGSELCQQNCMVTPLQIVADSLELSRIEKLLTDVIRVYGTQCNETETDDDKASDQD